MGSSVAVVIEDDPDHSRLIGMLLRDLGFTVHTASAGPDGVDAVRRLEPDVITTDLKLPGFGGQEVIRQVRVFSDSPILIVSASHDIRDVQQGLGAGADAFLPKPFRLKVMRAYLEALLRRPALSGQAVKGA
jgi:DNA-binding response OmpR family regulator